MYADVAQWLEDIAVGDGVNREARPEPSEIEYVIMEANRDCDRSICSDGTYQTLQHRVVTPEFFGVGELLFQKAFCYIF